MKIELSAFVLLPLALAAQPLRLERTIPMPGVEGRIDHMAADVEHKRLFVAALGNNSVEVIDPFAGRVLHEIVGLHGPQGVFYWPEGNRLYVADGGSGKVIMFDGASFAKIREYDFNSDPDNIRFDPKTKEVYVGYGGGALGVIAALGSRVGETVLAAHPESFELERDGPRIFVNVPEADQIAVLDRRTRAVIAKWTIDGARENFPMALDEAGKRLFVGCRKPPKLVTFDTQSGKQVDSRAVAGDSDDLFFDAKRNRVYASGGAGFVSVIDPQSAVNVPTAAGARTALFVPEFDRLYVAVPHRKNQPAGLMVFAITP